MSKIQLSVLLALGLISSSPAFSNPSDSYPKMLSIQLANNYQHTLDINKYWLSEKLDGIRAYWNGSQLLTRRGHKINAPDWFIASLPNIALDGELWAGRNGFQKVLATVLDVQPDAAKWQDIRFMVFDLPESKDIFSRRYAQLSQILQKIDNPYLGLVTQLAIRSRDMLFLTLENISEQNGEGVMLRRVDTHYRFGRTNDLIKLKKHQDAEAIVIGYTAGKGKYQGMVGALILQMPNGIEFKIGSG